MTTPETLPERPAYLICKRGAYYRPNAQGYTTSAMEAGRYTLAEAVRHSHPNGPDGPRDGITYVHEDEVTARADTRPAPVGVRPLEWRSAGCGVFVADQYSIAHEADDWWILDGLDTEEGDENHKSFAAAQDAAQDDYEARIRAHLCRPDRSPAGEVRVKPLVWDADGRDMTLDDTMVMGHGYDWDGYDLFRQEGRGLGSGYIIWPDHIGSSTYSLYGVADGLYIQSIRGEEAAKAAAQDDYEARILAALSPAPAPEREGLVEALRWYEALARDCRKVTDEGERARHTLEKDQGSTARAAIAAYEESQK